jgi:hypothetical protein
VPIRTVSAKDMPAVSANAAVVKISLFMVVSLR